MNRTIGWFAPGALLLLAAALLLQFPAGRDLLSALLPVYPYVLFAGGILLAWRFDRSRLALALLVLASADRALASFATPEAHAAGAGRIVFNTVGLLLPLDFGALSWIPERGLLTARGRLYLGVLLAQGIVAALICRPELAPVAALLEHRFADGPVLGWIAVPQPALAAFGLGLAMVTTRFIYHPDAIESGSVWALVASFLAMMSGSGGLVSTIYLTTAGLILVISLVETSHGMAYADELTGLPGRRALNEALRRLGGKYSIAMLDIDHFKRFNDEHGHDVGDQLLRMVASRLATVGGGGRAFRYGGEEFAVLFPGKSLAATHPHLETLRQAVEGSPFVVRGPGRPRTKPEKPRASAGRKRVSVTVSIGVAEPDRRNSTPERVLKAADAALYRAKKAGRNRVSA